MFPTTWKVTGWQVLMENNWKWFARVWNHGFGAWSQSLATNRREIPHWAWTHWNGATVLSAFCIYNSSTINCSFSFTKLLDTLVNNHQVVSRLVPTFILCTFQNGGMEETLFHEEELIKGHERFDDFVGILATNLVKERVEWRPSWEIMSSKKNHVFGN